MLLPSALIPISVVLLVIGVDRLILGAGGITRKLGIPPFLVGLTVAAAVTSMPEIFLSLSATLREETSLSLNTIIGSNIANIGLILGVAFLFIKNANTSEHVLKATLLLVAFTALPLGLLLDNYISRIDGLVLAIGYLIAIIWALRMERLNGPIYSTYDAAYGANITSASCIINAAVGLVLVTLAVFVLDIGVQHYERPLDDTFGILFLSTITSVPELYVCLVSTFRRENDFAIGTIIGSNLINLSLGLGVAAAVQPSRIPPASASFHIFVMVAFSMVLVAMILDFDTAKKQSHRSEGLALIIAYVAYFAYV